MPHPGSGATERLRAGATALLCAVSLGALPAHAAPTAYDVAFVDAFAEACVPGRLGYESSKAAATAAGWSEVAPDAHPELAALMAMSAEAVKDPEIAMTFDYVAYQRDIEGRPHYLVVSTTSAMIGDPEDPEDSMNPWIQTGCYLYDLDATVPLDPEPVTALIGNPISASQEEQGVVSHIWGPPCPMPMTGDTYLSFVAEGAPMATEMGLPFSGIALNFTTTQLDEGEPVPEPYCTRTVGSDTEQSGG